MMGIKEAYQEKADAQLREWHAWIKQFQSDPAGARSRKSVEVERVYNRLEDCYRIARIRLDELCSSQDERWEFAKQAVERAMIDLKQALDESGAGQAGKFLQLQTSRSFFHEPFQKRG